MKCPKCNSYLFEAAGSGMYQCESCDFRITKSKFDSLVNKMYASNRPLSDDEAQENLSELNNMEM